ncbi:MAG: hypothetical protein MJ238_06755 [Bacilli bacterium]|nr:hypothetical protein [Bacilli bacterium]
MSNELDKRNPNHPIIAHQYNGEVSGGYFANGDIYHTTYGSNIHRQFMPIGFKVDYSFFSIVVCDYDDDNLFVIRKSGERVMTEISSSEFKKIIVGKTQEEILKEIKRHPAIIVKPKSDVAYYGYITSLNVEGGQYVMTYFLLTAFPTKGLLNHGDKFGLDVRPLHNDLEEERWIVHNGDVRELLRNEGIELPIV